MTANSRRRRRVTKDTVTTSASNHKALPVIVEKVERGLFSSLRDVLKDYLVGFIANRENEAAIYDLAEDDAGDSASFAVPLENGELESAVFRTTLDRFFAAVNLAFEVEVANHWTPFRNSARFAVALYWGRGSSSLNAEVNAFDRDHLVRGWNSSYFGLK